MQEFFKEKLKKFKLVTNTICYGPEPEAEEEVEQRLSFNRKGDVYLTRLAYNKTEIEKSHLKIKIEKAEELLDFIAKKLSKEADTIYVTDVGTYELVLVNDEDELFECSGSVGNQSGSAYSGLSDVIRDYLGRDDLFVFDGNPERINRITINYNRNAVIDHNGLDGQPIQTKWNYAEKLDIDRESSTITYSKKIAEECTQTNRYYVQDGVGDLLDEFYPELFEEINCCSDEYIDNAAEVRDFRFEVTTNTGRIIEKSGSYAKDDLPRDWDNFMDRLYEFIDFYDGMNELFDFRIYGRRKRRTNDYIFCDVRFEDGYNTYCYLADTDDYKVGDKVVVPAGKDNHEAIVEIVDINYYDVDDAPYPVDKTKHILGKADLILGRQELVDTLKHVTTATSDAQEKLEPELRIYKLDGTLLKIKKITSDTIHDIDGKRTRLILKDGTEVIGYAKYDELEEAIIQRFKYLPGKGFGDEKAYKIEDCQHIDTMLYTSPRWGTPFELVFNVKDENDESR